MVVHKTVGEGKTRIVLHCTYSVYGVFSTGSARGPSELLTHLSPFLKMVTSYKVLYKIKLSGFSLKYS